MDWLSEAFVDMRGKGLDDYEIQLRMGLTTREFNLVLKCARGYSTVITDMGVKNE